MCTKPPQLSTVWLSSVEPQGKVWTSSRFSSSVLAQTCVLAVYCLCTSCVLRSQIVQCTRCSDKRFLSNTGIAVQNTVSSFFEVVLQCPVYNSCTKIYRWGMQPLVPLVFHNLPSLYPLHLDFGCAECTIKTMRYRI